MPTLTAFHSGVGPSDCSSVRRIVEQLVVIGREVARVDLDAIEKLPMRALSAGSIASTNSSAAFSTSVEVAAHAARCDRAA